MRRDVGPYRGGLTAAETGLLLCSSGGRIRAIQLGPLDRRLAWTKLSSSSGDPHRLAQAFLLALCIEPLAFLGRGNDVRDALRMCQLGMFSPMSLGEGDRLVGCLDRILAEAIAKLFLSLRFL